MGGKWVELGVELLLGIAPGLKRVAIMFNPDTSPASTYLPFLKTAARSLRVEPIITPVHSDAKWLELLKQVALSVIRAAVI
jgi:putative ABC transport system substrate-binding protein